MQLVNASNSVVYEGLSNAIFSISRAEGVKSLWRGLSSVVAGAGMLKLLFAVGLLALSLKRRIRACACGLLCYLRERKAYVGRKQREE